MTRCERIGSATLHLADCRDVLPTLSPVAVLLTDPVWPNVPPGSVAGSDRPWDLWAEACARLPAVDRAVVVMRCDSDPRFLSCVPPLPFFRTINLPYAVPGYLGRCLGGDEVAYWFGSPIAFAANRQLVPGRAPATQPGQRMRDGHPMARAQSHFDWLVHWCSDAGETVLDPFMGGGTTGVACARVGRPFVGIEIELRCFDIACDRIARATDQGDLLRGAA